MGNRVDEAYTYTAISATANVMPAVGMFFGFVVTSYTAGATVTVYDSATTTTSPIILDTITVDSLGLLACPAIVKNGVYVVITGTIKITTLTKLARDY
jgi:hypothetical protein